MFQNPYLWLLEIDICISYPKWEKCKSIKSRILKHPVHIMSYMYIILVWNDQAIILEHAERVFDHLYGFCEDDEKGWKSGLHTNTRVQLWINNIIKQKYSMLKSWILGDAASVSQLWHNLFSKYPPILYFLENSGRICFSRWNNCLRNISSTYFLA